jgi:hypothetical protein
MTQGNSSSGVFDVSEQPSGGYNVRWNEHDIDKAHGSVPGAWKQFVDSFRRDPRLAMTPRGVLGANGRVFDPADAAIATANSPLARQLKGRHLQMIAIGGSIGELDGAIMSGRD